MQKRTVERASSAASLSLAVLLWGASPAAAQLRVSNWNVTNYGSGRVTEFQSAIYDTGPSGRRYFPDIIIAEEIVDAAGATNFVNLLNTWPGGPTDWAASPYVATTVNPGSNPASCLFYRTSKVTLLTQAGVPSPSTVKVLTTGTGSCSTCPPRDNPRYLVRLVGYPAGTASELYLYAAHYKAGTGSSNEVRRTPESDRIRLDTNALPAGSNFILGADLNMQDSQQAAYVSLVGNGANGAGRFNDPINSPSSGVAPVPANWENESYFRFIHTQDPAVAMDSRHDQLLISTTLRNGTGLDYIGSASLPFSTTTWNDPNHSYRCWGNDGTSFNAALTLAGNAHVGQTIATNLKASANGLGHLPVFLDLRVPAKVNAPVAVNFGTVPQNSVATATIVIRNGDALVAGSDPHFQRFSRDGTSAGFETLSYTILPANVPAGFSTPTGTFTRAANLSAGNSHTVTLNTSTPGTKSGVLTLTSVNAAGVGSVTIALSGIVQAVAPPCIGDIADDAGTPLPSAGTNTGINEGDYNAFFAGFFDGLAYCDIADDAGTAPPESTNTGVNEGDYNAFFQRFFNGCP